MEFIIRASTAFSLAGLGQAFFYLHLFRPYLPIWVASIFLFLPWSVVFVIFYHGRPLFTPRIIRRWWLAAGCACAVFTVTAEIVWALGYLPPSLSPENKFVADVFVQMLMNLVWLSFIPMFRDYKNNLELWQ